MTLFDSEPEPLVPLSGALSPPLSGWGPVNRVARLPMGRLVIFGFIGASGFVPNLVGMYVLADLAGVNFLAASVISTVVANLWNFLLVDTLIYRGAGSRPWWARSSMFVLINTLDLPVRLPMIAILTHDAHLGYVMATGLSLVAMFAIRFLVTDRVVYRYRRGVVPTTPSPAQNQ